MVTHQLWSARGKVTIDKAAVTSSWSHSQEESQKSRDLFRGQWTDTNQGQVHLEHSRKVPTAWKALTIKDNEGTLMGLMKQGAPWCSFRSPDPAVADQAQHSKWSTIHKGYVSQGMMSLFQTVTQKGSWSAGLLNHYVLQTKNNLGVGKVHSEDLWSLRIQKCFKRPSLAFCVTEMKLCTTLKNKR